MVRKIKKSNRERDKQVYLAGKEEYKKGNKIRGRQKGTYIYMRKKQQRNEEEKKHGTKTKNQNENIIQEKRTKRQEVIKQREKNEGEERKIIRREKEKTKNISIKPSLKKNIQ